MPFAVTKDTRINELLLNCPASMEILLNHGFHCVGCSLSAYETLDEGAKAHGYSDEEVAKIVEEINDAGREFERKFAEAEKESARRLAEEKGAAAKAAAEKEEAIWLGKANFKGSPPAGGNPEGFAPPKAKPEKTAATKGRAEGKKKAKKKS